MNSLAASQLLSQWKALLLGIATMAATISQTMPNAIQAVNSTAQNLPAQSGASRNWAGYSISGTNNTSVSATWSIPSVTGTGHTSADAEWVGIGGISSSDLIQAGTQNIVSPSGQVSTQAFYETLPNASQTIPVTINTNDSVTVSITQQSNGQWQINFKDNTTNGTYSTNISYASSLSSAEWILEAPSNGRSILPLDNFNAVSFSSCSVTENNTTQDLSQSNALPIQMDNNLGQQLATASGIGGDGASFTIARTSAQSSSPIPQFDRNPGSWRRHGSGIGGFYRSPTYRFRYLTPTTTPSPSTSIAPMQATVIPQAIPYGFRRHFNFTTRRSFTFMYR